MSVLKTLERDLYFSEDASGRGTEIKRTQVSVDAVDGINHFLLQRLGWHQVNDGKIKTQVFSHHEAVSPFSGDD